MSKVNLTESILNSLTEQDGGKFQRIANAYLSAKGYKNLTATGSKIGTDKTTQGTPDAYFRTQNGKYILVEYSCQQSGLYAKFKEDIEKCLNTTKTGIPINQIDKIILCHTSILHARNFLSLKKLCEPHQIELEEFGLNCIAMDLEDKYPWIAKKYLGIQIDTGQIVTKEEFISYYEKSRVATSISNQFFSRENELKLFDDSYAENELIIISGPSGVGKTRFALECCERICRQDIDIKNYFVINLNLPIFEDLKKYLYCPENYLIVIDDANRLNQFDHIMNLFLSEVTGRRLKIVVTVRDYALQEVLMLSSHVNHKVIYLTTIDDGVIEKILKNKYNITNIAYLKKIHMISQGNTRLAMMAAELLKDKNTSPIPTTTLDLYDQYFKSVLNELEIFKDKILLKFFGIVAFFGSVDRTNNDLMELITTTFQLSRENFWEAAKIAHPKELVEIHADEVIKITDQILNTYLFYFVFFKEETLSFEILLSDAFFPRFKDKLKDAILPILNDLNNETLRKKLIPIIKNKLNNLDKNNTNYLDFLEIFHSVETDKTLLYIRDLIEAESSETIPLSEVKFEINAIPYSENHPEALPRYINILPITTNDGALKISLELLLSYLDKKPKYTPKILDLFIRYFGIKYYSSSYHYKIQKQAIETIWKRCQNEQNDFFPKFYCCIAKEYLQANHSFGELSRGKTLTLGTFNIDVTKEFLTLRTIILEQLLKLYEQEICQKEILNIIYLQTQPSNGLKFHSNEIIELDSKILLPFFKLLLQPNNVYHCFIVQKFLKRLNRANIQYDKDILFNFSNDACKVYDLIFSFKKEDQDIIQNNLIQDITTRYSLDKYEKLFDDLQYLFNQIEKNAHILNRFISMIFKKLINCNNNEFFFAVLKKYLQHDDYFNIQPASIFTELPQNQIKGFRCFLMSFEYPTKNKWLFAHYINLPSNQIKSEDFTNLLTLYEESKINQLPNHYDYLLKYDELESGFLLKVLKLLFERAHDTPQLSPKLELIFNEYSQIYNRINEFLKDNFLLFEDIYLLMMSTSNFFDHSNVFLANLLKQNANFIDKYLTYMSKDYHFWNRVFLGHGKNYRIMWQQKNTIFFERVLKKALSNQEYFFTTDEIKVLFNNNYNELSIESEQDQFLESQIANNIKNIDYINILFTVILTFSEDRKLHFYRLFLRLNTSIHDFKKLLLEPIMRISDNSGSIVPVFESENALCHHLIKFCDSSLYLEHRDYLSDKIYNKSSWIDSEKKREFTGDWP